MPKFVVVERDYTALGAKMSSLGPLVEKLGTVTKGVNVKPVPEVEALAPHQRRHPGRDRGRAPVAGHRHPRLRDDPGAVGHHQRPGGRRGLPQLEERTGQQLADLALDHEGKRITFPDTQARPVPVITSPEWSGSEHGGRRYTAFAINVERLKPWHTLTGRQHFFLDHDWMTELGEQLPIYRPPLNMHRIFGDQSSGVGKEVTVRYLTPHSKWSIHSEYQDNLFMLSLSRGGPEIWMSVEDADADRRQGQRVDRGLQPERRGGRSRDRLAPDAQGDGLHVPRQGPRGRRAAHRDVRAARWHPQLADAADAQAQPPRRRLRAAVVLLQLPRAHRQPTRRGHGHPSPLTGGRVLMKVMAQMGMVMNLDKCIGCHTCSVTCKQAWTNRTGVEYVWFNNVETRPGLGYPRTYEDQETSGEAGGNAPAVVDSGSREAVGSRSSPRSSPTPSCRACPTTTSRGRTSTTR